MAHHGPLPTRCGRASPRALERNQQRGSTSSRRSSPIATMWNKWPTARRFQREGSCCLRCSPQAQDSIEHYACCPIIRSVASSSLRLELQPPPHAITDFLLITPPPSPDPTVTPPRRCLRMALLVTAAYNTTNAARHKPPRAVQETMDMMCQSLREAARNHPSATDHHGHHHIDLVQIAHSRQPSLAPETYLHSLPPSHPLRRHLSSSVLLTLCCMGNCGTQRT